MTDLSPILPKLAKLVPRLGSNADGEIVATVRAINRTLRAGGFDWHDFTSALAPALPLPARPARASRPQSWQEIAAWCARHGMGVLGPMEMTFVLDMARELGRFRQPTEKQAKWLRGIYARLGGMQ